MITILSKYRLKADEESSPAYYLSYDAVYLARKEMRKLINKSLFPKASIGPKENSMLLTNPYNPKQYKVPNFWFDAAQAFSIKSPSSVLSDALKDTPFTDGLLSYGVSVSFTLDEKDLDKAKVGISLFTSTGKKFSEYKPQPTASKFTVEGDSTVDSVREAFDKVGEALAESLYDQAIALIKKPKILMLTLGAVKEVPARTPDNIRLQVKQTKDNEFAIKGFFVKSYVAEVRGFKKVREAI